MKENTLRIPYLFFVGTLLYFLSIASCLGPSPQKSDAETVPSEIQELEEAAQSTEVHENTLEL